MSQFRWFLIALLQMIAAPAFGQLAPTGEHYAGRASDTGYTGAPNKTGTYAATIPLDLPVARGGLPVPLQIVYGAHGVGAAGLGWDIPLSYIQRDRTFAHRRPLSAPGTLPVPRERAYLSLLGQAVELERQGNSDDWLAYSGTLALTVRQTGDIWQADDGTGRVYTFVRPAVFGQTGMWLLHSVSAAGGARVELTYQTVSQTLDGGHGIEISLTRLRYNPHPTAVDCWKNEVVLAYGLSAHPLSLSILGDKILARHSLLTGIDVESRATCEAPFERLRRYQFEYPRPGYDPDTGLPRLRAVRMFGREGTPEEFTSLPVAAYDYGTATQGGVLQYQATQPIALPPDAAPAEVSGTFLDTSVSLPATGQPYTMWQTLIDINGDGRPDLVFQKNNKLWVAYNQPAPGGATTIGAPQAIAQLSDATFSGGPFSAHTSTQPRFHYLPAKSNVVYVWRQAIDINGDGRVDIIDASEQPDHWVVYLNTPGPQGTVKWQRRSYSVTALRKTLTDFGHIVPNDYVPLSTKATGTNLKVWVCWKWSHDDNKWYWYSEGFVNHACEGVDGGVDGSSVERGQERTFVDWEVKDINGDGYPDVVFNSSPVTFQLNPPPFDCTPPHHCPGDVFPTAWGIGGKTTVRFGPGANTENGPNNAIRAMFNVLGVRFYTDDNPFAQSVDLVAPLAGQGVEQWACSNADAEDFTCPDHSLQSQVSGLVDVNGDGLLDRVVGTQAFLGTYAGPAAAFSSVYLNLPGPLATQKSTYASACVAGNPQEPTAEQIQGLRDLTGDGIPDYIDTTTGRAWIGTGAGFLHHVGIAVSGGNFSFSHETESCDGRASITGHGLFDIDGDGRPDIVESHGNTLRVSRLSAGGALGAPEAGQLIQIDNGYGAVTHIGYVSAKTFTDNPVPFPEIVVSSVAIAGTQNLGGTLAGTRYAYSNAELVFDSNQDRFAFPGYRRSIELRLFPAPRSVADDSDRKLIGTATVTDLWPMPEFKPWFSKDDRWMHTQRLGRVSDVMTVRGSGTLDPWSLLNVDASNIGVVGVTHTDWDAKRFESPPPVSAPGLPNCIEMVDPLNFQTSLANAGNIGVDICRTHGFAFWTLTESWYGGSPPPSTNNIQTRSRVLTVDGVLAVDDFGRVTLARYDNDVFRSDDDVCVENRFAAATAFPRVLTAVAQRKVIDCDKRNVYASESFEYDHLSPGAVSNGRVTSHTVDRRDTSNGALIKSVRVFDAAYDPLGNLASIRTARDGATRTVSFDHDPFGLVPIHARVDATGIEPMDHALSVDPISLGLLGTTDLHQVQRGYEFDGFGRWVRTTLTLPDGTSGIVASAAYDGFGGTDPQGRRVKVTRYMDPVPAAALAGTVGRSGTMYLDELGRERRTELALGPDYNDESLVVGLRTYDAGGRIAFAARPYPKSQSASDHYGTTYYYKTTGDLDCLIRGSGPQAFTMATDVSNERYPECFDRGFDGHVLTTERRDASSLQANSPQAGVVHRVVASAIGNVLEQSTMKAGTRLEYASFARDRLGQLTAMSRFLTPATGVNPVRWMWRLDSLGQVLQFMEPESPPRFFEYSDWGELTDARWSDGSMLRQIVSRFDALGRLTGADERNNGVVDPATVRKFVYDTPADLSPYATPTFVRHRLSQASSPKGQVVFSYDALGHVSAEVFRDDVGGIYAHKSEYHAGGRLAMLVFNLPDGNYADEAIKYEYDSAGRLRTIMAPDASGTHALYQAQVIDPLGRVRKALYGGSSAFAADYAAHGRQFIREIDFGSPLGSRRILFGNFDASGRESARQEFVDGVGGSPTFFQYDALARLASVQSMGATPTSWQFSYDPLGNIRKLTDLLGNKDASLSYRAVDRDRICRIEYSQNLTGTDCNVAYDASGAMTGEPTRNGSRQLSYFSSGAIRTLSQGDSLASFTYDAFGRLQQLDVQSGSSPDQRRDRHYGALIQKRDIASGSATSTQIVRRVLGPGGIVATRRGPGDDWIYGFGERRGNRFFVNDAGAFVQGVDYQPFGEAKSTGAPPGDTDYSSQQWNDGDALAAFGLVNLGARVYDPVIGRFLSRDPLLIAGGATTSNPYAFARNDPVSAADPSGLQAVPNLAIQSGSGSGGDGSAGPAVGPLAPNLEQTAEHFVSMFFGGGNAIAPTPSISTGPGGLLIVNIGSRPLAEFTGDWAHEPIVEPWYMRVNPLLAAMVKWHDCGWPCRVVDVAMLATGIGGLARLGSEIAIEGVGFTAVELGGAGTESTVLTLRAAGYGAGAGSPVAANVANEFVEEEITTKIVIGEGESTVAAQDVRIVAGYRVVGTAQRIGDTYRLTITGWTARGQNPQGLTAFVTALRNEAAQAGASNIEIVGDLVGNEDIANLSAGAAARFGFSLERLSPISIRLFGTVQ